MVAFLVVVLILLFGLGVPIGFSLAGLGLTLGAANGVPLAIAPQRMIFGIDSFTLLAIPLFLLAGNLMNVSGVTNRIYDFAAAMVGHWRGGLAHVNVIGSMIFAGMSGSALADAAGLGSVEIRAMTDEGYAPEFAAAVTAASSTIGPIIPPSIGFVLYAHIAEVSVGRLLLAGILPGTLMGLSMMGLIWVMARTRAFPSRPRATFRQRARAGLRAVLPLFTPVILIGGMVTGVFTATEAAGVAVAYALVLGVLVYRELGLRDVARAFRETALTTAGIMIIVSAATFLAWMLARQQITQSMSQAVLGVTDNPLLVLLLMNVLLLILGMFIDTAGILLIVGPVVAPVVAKLGIDPVHFGVVFLVNLMIGLITPPVGMALFVAANVAKRPVMMVARATAPFIIPLLVTLLLITYFPAISLYIPNLVFGPSKPGL